MERPQPAETSDHEDANIRRAADRIAIGVAKHEAAEDEEEIDEEEGSVDQAGFAGRGVRAKVIERHQQGANSSPAVERAKSHDDAPVRRSDLTRSFGERKRQVKQPVSRLVAQQCVLIVARNSRRASAGAVSITASWGACRNSGTEPACPDRSGRPHPARRRREERAAAPISSSASRRRHFRRQPAHSACCGRDNAVRRCGRTSPCRRRDAAAPASTWSATRSTRGRSRGDMRFHRTPEANWPRWPTTPQTECGYLPDSTRFITTVPTASIPSSLERFDSKYIARIRQSLRAEMSDRGEIVARRHAAAETSGGQPCRRARAKAGRCGKAFSRRARSLACCTSASLRTIPPLETKIARSN